MTQGKMMDGGRLVVPAAMRRALGLQTGDTVTLELDGDELRVRPAKSALKRLRDTLRGETETRGSVVDELIAERRQDAADD